MTKKKQRIAIAEACGWTDCHKSLAGFDNGDGITERWLIGVPPGKSLHRIIPDYLNDLNAMHEAEKVLMNDQCAVYLATIAERLPETGVNSWVFKATAAQRADAFLRTLNLWKE